MTRLALIFSLLFVTPAWAYTHETYEELVEINERLARLYIQGIAHGIAFTSGEYLDEGAEEIFCWPQTLDLTPSLVETAIENSYNIDPESMGKHPVGILATYGLRQMFPCDE